MLGIGDRVIMISVQIIRQETDSLQVGHQYASLREGLFFFEREKVFGFFHESGGESLEIIHVKMHLVKIAGFLSGCVTGRTNSIPEVVMYDSRHHGVQIDHA